MVVNTLGHRSDRFKRDLGDKRRVSTKLGHRRVPDHVGCSLLAFRSSPLLLPALGAGPVWAILMASHASGFLVSLVTVGTRRRSEG